MLEAGLFVPWGSLVAAAIWFKGNMVYKTCRALLYTTSIYAKFQGIYKLYPLKEYTHILDEHTPSFSWTWFRSGEHTHFNSIIKLWNRFN